MELALSPEDAAFRDEVRAFIADNYPAEMRVPNPETDLTKEQMLLWHRILHKKGWIAPLWPKEYGGPGWSITRRFIFEQETTRAGTMPPLAFSVTMVGPVIYTFGNDGAEAEVSAAHSVGRGLVVPGLFRAGIGLRPRHRPHQGGARRRPLHRQRSQDLDHAGPARRLDLLPGPHRSGRKAAIRHFVPPDRHEVAGRHRAPDHHHRRLARGQ